jgi:DNA-binding transcriptional regulator YiaG
MSLTDPILAAAYGHSVLKTKRKRYSVNDKLNAIKKVRQLVESDKVSFRAAAAKLSLDHALVSKWRQEEEKLHNASSKKLKSLCVGHMSLLQTEDIEKELLGWIFKQRQQGLAVSNVSVLIKIASLSRKFRQKSFMAQYSAVARQKKRTQSCQLARIGRSKSDGHMNDHCSPCQGQQHRSVLVSDWCSSFRLFFVFVLSFCAWIC